MGERAILRALCVVGYVNFVCLTFVAWNIKGPGSWPALLTPPAIAFAGTALYHLAWDRSFPETSKAEGRRFMRPYLLGAYLSLAVVAFILILGFLAGQRKS